MPDSVLPIGIRIPPMRAEFPGITDAMNDVARDERIAEAERRVTDHPDEEQREPPRKPAVDDGAREQERRDDEPDGCVAVPTQRLRRGQHSRQHRDCDPDQDGGPAGQRPQHEPQHRAHEDGEHRPSLDLDRRWPWNDEQDPERHEQEDQQRDPWRYRRRLRHRVALGFVDYSFGHICVESPVGAFGSFKWRTHASQSYGC